MMQDRDDYRKIMSAIIRQAIEDYIKMQHPKQRRRKYEREAFWSARDLFWDPDFVLNFEDELGSPMTLETLAMAASDRDNVDLDSVRQYIVDEANKYWEEKTLKTLEIPEDVVVEGHAYQIQNADTENLDLDNKIIFLNLEDPLVEEHFMTALVNLTCYHNEIKTSGKARKDMGRALYRLLRINNCFTGDI